MVKSQHGGFAVTKDKLKKDDVVVKVFGLFQNPSAFLNCLRSLPSNERCMYELILEQSPCKAHADIEWIGKAEEGHGRIRKVVRSLREKLLVDFPQHVAEIYVLCGSRTLQNGDFKHSYHVIVGNMVFPTNHDGQMQHFFSSLCVDDDWFYAHKGEKKCIVDLGIYTRNRSMRAPYCQKFGEGGTPLIRISATNDELVDDYHDLSSVDDDELLSMLITTLGAREPMVVGTEYQSRKRKSSENPVQSPKKRPAATPLQQVLTDLLRMRGDHSTRVGSCKTLNSGALQVQCVNVGGRECLCSPGIFHRSNNCLLHVLSDPMRTQGPCKVTYTCMSTKHETRRLMDLGYVIRDSNTGGLRATAEMQVNPRNVLHPATGDQVDAHTARAPQVNHWCQREILLTSDLDLDTSEALLLISSLKTVDRGEEVPEVLAEWCTRSLSCNAAKIHELWTRAPGGVDDPLGSLHKLRLAYPALTLRSHGMPSSEDTIRFVLRSIDVDRISWSCLTRVMKQVDPRHRDDVLKFVEDVYAVDHSAALCVWDRGGSFESQHLKDYMDMLLCQDKLLTESLPLIMGAPLIKYFKRDDDTLEFWLDVPPFNKQHVLYLDSGIVDGNLNLKQFSAIGGPNADSSLAEALEAVGIGSKLKYDLEEQVFRSFNAGSGKWERHDGGDDRAWALAQIMREITKWLKVAIHIQEFHEDKPTDSLKNRRKLLIKYGESARAADEVLKLLRPRISSKFQTPKHLICFSNGIVDLKTGELLGPAKPEDCVKHSIPHPYDPSVDTSEFQEIMLSFFPPNCYGSDSVHIVEFLQRWQGYRLTGETSVQKSLWLTGRGSNGKSVLSNLNAVAFGPEIHHSLSMEAFQQEGIGNNDDLFAAMHARCVDVMENTDNRKINEKLFKSLTGGDGIQVAAKYKTGIKVQPQMKICFFNNDCPVWSSADCFALSRRCLNLPMRAQFLDPDCDTAESTRLKEEGHESWIFEKKATLEQELKAHHIPAYLKWCVEGSVKFYGSGLAEPKIIKDASGEERKDKVELLEDFVVEHIERCEYGSDKSLSTEEIRNVFLMKEGFLHSLLDKKTEDALNQKLKKLLTEQGMFSGVAARTLKKYPTRRGPKDVKGYVGVRWKKGEITPFVNAWKRGLLGRGQI